MTYELAKEFKEAGFPQKINQQDKYLVVDGDKVRIPKLEELIEACGEKFAQLIKLTSGNWTADGYMDDGNVFDSEAATPTAAVARLWLALKK